MRNRVAFGGLAMLAMVAACASRAATVDSTARARTALTDVVVAAAQRPEKPGDDGDWDHALNVALAVRGRIELLRAGLGTPAERGLILRRAREGAAIVLSWEATGPRLSATLRAELGGARGWGTMRPLKLGPFIVEGAVDAYSTAVALSGLAELALYELEQGERSRGEQLLDQVTPVADHWVERRRFDVPGGVAFEKIASSDARVRDYIVHNTDAMLARALLVLADGCATRTDTEARVTAYRDAALAVARRLDSTLLDQVIDERGRVDAARWVYGLERRAGEWVPQRLEDTNHASFLLDFLVYAVDHGLRAAPGLPPLFSPREVRALAGLLPAAGFIQAPDGGIAYTVYVDPATVTSDARGKTRSASFAFRADGARRLGVTTWWRELAGETRTLDMGLSIRTSWGWIEAARGQPALLAELGAYLDAAARSPEAHAANLFLSQATWLRVTGGPSQRP